MKFIGREKELHILNDLYQKPNFQMAIIYGRRRIGKSTLISEFIKGKKAVFYTSTKVGAEKNLDLFASQLLRALEMPMSGVRFDHLDSVLDLLSDREIGEKLVIAIDELPYWAESDESILSVFQKYIDTKWQSKNILLILCGSALSFMENKVLSEKSPLFGRRTAQIKLEAFSYKESGQFVEHYSLEEQAIAYGITGGVPKYLSLLDDSRSLDENIKTLFFDTSGYLYDECRNLLVQEFNDTALVNNLIEEIAKGETSLNNLSLKVKEDSAKVLYSLKRLMEIGLVEKRYCITEEKNKKKTQYVLRDSMFQFWYAFIPKAMSLIEIGQGYEYYDLVVKNNIHQFMGTVFEGMCRDYVLRHALTDTFSTMLTKVGMYWGKENIVENGDRGKKVTTTSADIDVVGISDIEKTAVVGECKFKNEKIDRSVYETLVRRSRLISGKYRVKKYLLFSLGGFTDWVLEREEEELLLFGLEDLYE